MFDMSTNIRHRMYVIHLDQICYSIRRLNLLTEFLSFGCDTGETPWPDNVQLFQPYEGKA